MHSTASIVQQHPDLLLVEPVESKGKNYFASYITKNCPILKKFQMRTVRNLA
jgi:hypothetical protein